MILVLDNYDSFVHNLARYLHRLGQSTSVVRSDTITAKEIKDRNPTAIVISPGPCTPQEAGCSLEVVRELWNHIPILGVCLGHQAIAEALGGRVIRAPEPRHGRTSQVIHNERGVFQNVPNPVTVCRYHSLVADPATLPSELKVTGRTADGIIMAFEHEKAPVIGLQFHPEAILTQSGFQMLANFLSLAGLPIPSELPTTSDELTTPPTSSWTYPTQPVTF